MYNLAVLQMKGLVRERTDSTKLLIQAAKLNHTKVSISNQYVYITHYDDIQQLCISFPFPETSNHSVVTRDHNCGDEANQRNYLLMNLNISSSRQQALSSWVPREV